jgi:HEAT repeat protein
MKLGFYLKHIGGISFVSLGFVLVLHADIIHLKNGSTIEGKLIEETKTQVVLDIGYGQIYLKRAEIDSIVIAEYVQPEYPSEASVPPPCLPPESKPATPTAGTIPVSKIIPLKRDTPFRINLQTQTTLQAEINTLLEQLVNLKEGEPWVLAGQLADKGRVEIPYLLLLLDKLEEPPPEAGSVETLPGSPLARAALHWVIYTLGNSRNEAVIKPLISRINTPDERVRSDAIQALAQFPNDPLVIKVLKAWLTEEKSDTVLVSLINTLIRLGDTGALTQLVDMLGAEDQTVRYAAANVLRQIHQAMLNQQSEIDLVPILLERLPGAGQPMRQEILILLGQLKDPRAVEALIPLMRDSEAEVRSLAALALGELNDKSRWSGTGEAPNPDLSGKVTAYLIERLSQERDRRVKTQLILALQKTNDFSAVPVLLETLQDSDENVRFTTARALRTITKQSWGENYESWKQWWDTFKGK